MKKALQCTYSGSAGIAGDHDDGANGSVLGHETGGVTTTERSVSGLDTLRHMHVPGRQHEDSTGVLLERCRHSGHGTGLSGWDWSWGKRSQLVECVDIWNGNLGEQASLVHHGDGLLGVVTLGGLSGQHDTVGAVQDCVTDIGNLGAGWARVVGHALQHLGGANDGLAGHVALGDHHLLGNEHLGWWDLDTKVTTSDHDTVGELQDLVEVVDTLLVLDLGDDLDVLALLAEHLTDGSDVLTTADEGCKDHVDLVLDTELEIGLVLLRERWEIDIGLWKVDALLGRDLAVVDALAAEGLVVDNLEDLECKDTVIDVDGATLLNDLGDVLVVDVPSYEN